MDFNYVYKIPLTLPYKIILEMTWKGFNRKKKTGKISWNRMMQNKLIPDYKNILMKLMGGLSEDNVN